MNLQLLLYLLLLCILGLSYALLYLLRKVSTQRKILDKPQEDYGESLVLVQEAQKQANAIVERAVESAKHILFETEYVKHDITKEMQDSLQRVADETIKMVQGRSTESEQEFRAVVSEIKSDFEKVAAQKLDIIGKVTEEETNDFKEILRRETLGAQEIISRKINTDFELVSEELKQYRKTKLEQIDRNIHNIIKQVIIDALGKNTTLSVQEDLVIQSLEEAKKTGFFKTLENPEQVVIETK